jgi:hypothetical protein
MPKQINPSFLFDLIRKYNRASHQIYKDRILVAVGLHVGLLQEDRATLAPILSSEERHTILYFLRQFCESEGISVKFK